MQCVKPVWLSPADGSPGFQVPCGKCIQCRIKKREEWKTRCLHELLETNQSVFVTLTYAEKYLPKCGSLKKSDLQKFFKRLRKSLEGTERKIRYFASGEYGSKEWTERPHYHLIIFGLDVLSLDDKKLIMDAWPFMDWSVKSIRKNAFGAVEPESIGYVTGYIEKKLSGEKADEEYNDTGREPVFRVCSMGTGKNYAEKNEEEIKRNGFVWSNGKKMSIPRYYVNRLGMDLSAVRAEAIHRQCEANQKLLGIYIDDDSAYMSQSVQTNLMLQEHKDKTNLQKERNLKSRLSLKRSKL